MIKLILQTTASASLLLLVMVIISCNSQPAATNDTTGEKTVLHNTGHPIFDKLVGTWKLEDGKSFERWRKSSDSTYASVAFSLKGTDTAWNEQASIYPQGEQWVFENTVAGQNQGKAVRFVSSSLSNNSVQFSNPAHDFPTDVNYTVVDANTVRAFIVGPNSKGGKDTIPFNYTRVSEP